MATKLKDKDRREIRKLYLSGMKPEEIANRFEMKPASLRQHLYREGLTKMRGEVEETRRRTTAEIVEEVREQHRAELAEALGEQFAGITEDAKRLRDGWGLVKDAAGASSLMRSKNLLLDRTLRSLGAEKPEDQANVSQTAISFFFMPSTAVRRIAEQDVTPEPPNSARTS